MSAKRDQKVEKQIHILGGAESPTGTLAKSLACWAGCRLTLHRVFRVRISKGYPGYGAANRPNQASSED